mmetsp:Transcript_57990/g.135604  ORF Transcript_57990/g.135604 Transcript_57990/m.135604 type:complete len:316 (+) Transcript_57990:929-1876(+)
MLDDEDRVEVLDTVDELEGLDKVVPDVLLVVPLVVDDVKVVVVDVDDPVVVECVVEELDVVDECVVVLLDDVVDVELAVVVDVLLLLAVVEEELVVVRVDSVELVELLERVVLETVVEVEVVVDDKVVEDVVVDARVVVDVLVVLQVLEVVDEVVESVLLVEVLLRVLVLLLVVDVNEKTVVEVEEEVDVVVNALYPFKATSQSESVVPGIVMVTTDPSLVPLRHLTSNVSPAPIRLFRTQGSPSTATEKPSRQPPVQSSLLVIRTLSIVCLSPRSKDHHGAASVFVSVQLRENQLVSALPSVALLATPPCETLD